MDNTTTYCQEIAHSHRRPFLKLVAFLSAAFSMFSKTSCFFSQLSSKLLTIFDSCLFVSYLGSFFWCYCLLSWKLLAIFVGSLFAVIVSCLGSFLLLLSVILEASHYKSAVLD